MSSGNSQKWVGRNRPPRVHIEYDVEIGGAIKKRELPFVVGVLADLSGKPDAPLPKVEKREFQMIDRDNFNDVLEGIAPRLAFQVDNTLQDDGSKLNVELRFKHMDDFHPEQVVKQVEPLRKLIEARERLSRLAEKMSGNDQLEALLQDVLSNTDAQKTLLAETGRGGTPEEEA